MKINIHNFPCAFHFDRNKGINAVMPIITLDAMHSQSVDAESEIAEMAHAHNAMRESKSRKYIVCMHVFGV